MVLLFVLTLGDSFSMARSTHVRLPDSVFNVPVRGGDLAVVRYGPENGLPILAIHGITSSN